MTLTLDRIGEADAYMQQRTGRYEYRQTRYLMALGAMKQKGLNDSHTVLDVGAGWTELDYCMRVMGGWKGRYIPLDMGIDGTDLETWRAPRRYDFAVGLEILEHLHEPELLVEELQSVARHIVVSVPNPRTVDVLAIDPTHVTPVTWNMLQDWGFYCEETTLYGGVWSDGQPDSIFGVWSA